MTHGTCTPDLIDDARDLGVDGYVFKTLPARDLVTALEAVNAGDTVVSAPRQGPPSSGLEARIRITLRHLGL